MQYRPLGRTDIRVSALCLGTMTFGEQNTEADAAEQLDRAVAAGINFIDTAEMYPVPPMARDPGPHRDLYRQLARRARRARALIIATKVAGPGDWLPHPRGGGRLDRANIEAGAGCQPAPSAAPTTSTCTSCTGRIADQLLRQARLRAPEVDDSVPLLETLGCSMTWCKAGKVRHVGLSNETPWGTMRFLALAERHGLPRMVSIQNPYNLLNRSFEIGLAEVAMREQCGLLAYSPLAFGMLSGKYLGGARPPRARLTLFARFDRYSNPEAVAATAEYVAIARRHGLDPAQMALAWVTSRPFVTSNIIGATTMAQLEGQNLASADGFARIWS
jgi:aryl-alcohol dehydrogenase-like predicted oxidoreductase